MRLNELSPGTGAKKEAKRKGRGHSAGQGKTSGRGVKGQKSRSGGFNKVGFEGGQMPLQRRLPKRGFTNIFKKEYTLISLSQLDRFEGDDVITAEILVAAGMVKKGMLVKVLANGEITRAVKIKVDKVSKAAQAKIEAAGGTVVADA